VGGREMSKGYWTILEIKAAKKLVKEIERVANDDNTFNKVDAYNIIKEARAILEAVRSNKELEDLILPL
jgi:ribosomal protein S6